MEITDPEEDAQAPPSKKLRVFAIKEFRNKLATSQKLLALQQFLNLCKNAGDQDYVFEYLEKGGSCLELYQLLEMSSDVPATLIMEIVHYILLGIVSQYPQFYTPAYESCRYFLNTHLALINKMLTLSSTTNERKTILKLLTVFITLSRNLAKEVLINVNFNPTNLEVLTKQTEEKDSVRNAFIHFLIAFLVEDHYPTVSLLLEKKMLLSSIINGLQYDSSDTVCMVILSLKNNVLENKLVSKTIKMNVFSTPVVKDVVNLYNWKGPSGFNSKKKLQNVVVDEFEKSRVNESVHSFLLVLCTSHTFGIIFKDRQLGLGKIHNNLMLTVLESLERPWEHSYASDLVIKICGACPDLAKNLWGNLRQVLEPRDTAQWYKAIAFLGELTKELKPTSIEFAVRDISVNQLALVIQSLVAPPSILKLIIPEKFVFEQPELKQHVLTALLSIYTALENFLTSANNWLKPQDLRTLKNLLSEHVLRTFPDACNLLQDWSQSDIEITLELLDLYQNRNPQLLESLSSIDLVTFLNKIKEMPDLENATFLQIRAIKVFVNFEPSVFSPQNEFGVVFPLILTYYYETKNQSAFTTLKLLLKNTGIFEGCLDEIDVWVNSIFDLLVLEANTCSIIVETIKMTSDNIFDYINKTSEFSRVCTEISNDQDNFEDILEMLSNDTQEETSVIVKTRSLSPLLFGCFEYLTKVEQGRNFKNYFSSVLINLLHSQPTPSLITSIILKYPDYVSETLVKYITAAPIILNKSKTRFAERFSAAFFEGSVDDYFTEYWTDIQQYPGQSEFHLNQALFYFANMDLGSLTDEHSNNCSAVIKFLVQQNVNHLDILIKIFTHPVLLQRFSPAHVGIPTMFLMNIIKESNIQEIGVFLKPYRSKIVDYLKRAIKKRGRKIKYAKVLELLDIFKLETQGCLNVLHASADWELSNADLDFLNFFYSVFVFCLRNLNTVVLDANVIEATINLLTFLYTLNNFDSSTLANALRTYLEIYPHYLNDLNTDLFKGILCKTEYCKENALLASFILGRKKDLLALVEEQLSHISTQKGLILGLLDAIIHDNVNDEFLKKAYDHFKPSLVKSLQKPQKAGQNFDRYKEVVTVLVLKFMEPDNFVTKIQKFDVAEPFHIQMLCSLFTKILSDPIVEKHVNNAILTLIQTTNLLFKRKADYKLSEIIKTTNIFFEKIAKVNEMQQISYRTLCENDSFQLYCKFCLKFGISGNVQLLTTMKNICQFVNFDEREAQLILDMASSHSEFLEILLNDHTACKAELLELTLVLCQRWPSLMQRNHIPVYLSAYRATLKRADRTVLILLQMYEKAANKTNFYDFKPFLWGTAAATHYSVRQNIQSALWRQPKMGDILDVLQESIVLNTIVKNPMDLGLQATRIEFENSDIYDISFFLPLFSSLLSPENEVAIYKFPKCGALSLTITALGSNNKEIRLAACHVLSRWHLHVESRQGGRNRPLWLRYTEAICRGTAVLKHCKLNNFSSIFWAKMALILTQPLLPLYIPLTYYLGAKMTPNLDTIPELYTFLHSSHVNYKEMRLFILEVIRDGLRTDNDFSAALHSMAFKLIMELYSSCVTNEDSETKCLILSIINQACCLNLGKQLLVSSYGLLSWLYDVTCSLKGENQKLLHYIIEILHNIKDINSPHIFLIILYLIDKELVRALSQNDLSQFLQLIIFISGTSSANILDEGRLRTVISCTNNVKRCDYLLKYGCKYILLGSNCVEPDDLIELLVIKWINK